MEGRCDSEEEEEEEEEEKQEEAQEEVAQEEAQEEEVQEEVQEEAQEGAVARAAPVSMDTSSGSDPRPTSSQLACGPGPLVCCCCRPVSIADQELLSHR